MPASLKSLGVFIGLVFMTIVLMTDSAGAVALRSWPKYEFEMAFRFVDEKEDVEFQVVRTTYVSRQTWMTGAFDDLLWAVANEKAAHTLWMSCSTGAVFAPYDGGVDLFLPTDDLVAELKIKHDDWLPTNAYGL